MASNVILTTNHGKFTHVYAEHDTAIKICLQLTLIMVDDKPHTITDSYFQNVFDEHPSLVIMGVESHLLEL